MCVPTDRSGPHARIDLPHTEEDRTDVARSLLRGYASSPGPVLLIAFSDNRADADRAVDAVTMASSGVLTVIDSLQVHDGAWVSLTTGQMGGGQPR